MKKRSFKIATAFAGAAAATIGLGPAALAATALPTSRSGNIRNQLCSTIANGGSHWVHLYYPKGPNNVPTHDPECFGYTGFTTAAAFVWSACPGNNSGSLTFANAPTDRFHPGDPRGWVNTIRGTGHQASASLTKVRIFKWSNHATCTSP